MALTLDDIRTYSRNKHGHVTEGKPFGDDVIVFKVKGKIFLLADLVRMPFRVNLRPIRSRRSNGGSVTRGSRQATI